MPSDSDADVTSEEEPLSVKKRKVHEKTNLCDEISKYCDDSDEVSVVPECLVTVNIESMNESTSPIDYSTKEDPLASTSKPKKQSRKYACNQCKAAFDSKDALKTHSLEHQIETRHKCEYCGKCFVKAFYLKLHMKAHKEQIDLKCPLCDQIFTQKPNLDRHLTSHEPTKECKKCSAKFHTSGQLKSHLRSHDGIRKRKRRKPSVENPQSTQDNDDDIKLETCAEDNDIKEYNEYENCLKREELNHETQCAIVNKMHRGRPIGDICKLYNVAPEVVNQIWEDRDKYTIPKVNGKKNIKQLNNTLDVRLLEWFNEQRESQNQVTGKMLQDIAEEIAKELGFVAFNSSKKWLERFKSRYKITFRLQPVKRDAPSAASESKWKKAFLKENWPDARLGFTSENIYTADEVGFYYNSSKGRIKKQGSKRYINGYVKDRLAILMCTNVTGTDRRKLIVCGMEDPLIHSHRDPDTLPVNYIRHSQAHFTTLMFEEYVRFWNKELQRTNSKALLILDRATIHTKMQLSNLKLCFVPWKASVALMPTKNGIFSKFRDEFRRLLLEEKAINVLKGLDRNVTCMEALNMLEKAWRRIPEDVIVKSFKNTGYDVEGTENKPVIPKFKVTDEEALCQMLKDFDIEPYYTDLSTLDMYLTVDDELVTGQGTNCSVFGGNHKAVDPKLAEKEKLEILPISTEKPDTDEKERVIKRNRALEDLEIVRKYLMRNDTSYETYCHFMEVDKFMHKTPENFEY